MSNKASARGALTLVGVVCIAISVGLFAGAAVGWGFFGVAALVMVVADIALDKDEDKEEA